MNMRVHLTLLLLLALTTVRAQEIVFKASVDRTSIATGEQLQLTVQLTNSRERFPAPDLGGLVIVGGPFESSNISYVNGRMSSSLTRTWRLTATRPGTYTIGRTEVKVGGGVIATDPITISVSKGAATPTDPYATQGQSSDANLFATITVDKSNVHVGEQLVATYTLYSRYNNLELSKYELPKMTGFWAEEIDLGNSGWEPKPRQVNGVAYNVAVLKKQVLFPQKSGKLRIAPLELGCLVNRSFFDRGANVPVRSNALDITVNELPEPAPSDLTGAVGSLQLTAVLDRSNVNVNEPVQLDLQFNGRTNLKLLEAPKLELPQDLEAFDPKTLDKISVNGSGMSGSRTFQYLLIPRHEGQFELPSFTFSYFDPEKDRYVQLSTEAFTITVNGASAGGTDAPAERTAQRDVQQMAEDIRYIRTGDLELVPEGGELFGSAVYWASLTVPALAYLLLLGWQRRTAAQREDPVLQRRMRAERTARKALRAAGSALRSESGAAFHDALNNAMRGYLQDALSLSPAQLDEARIAAALERHAEGAQIAGEVQRILATCDMARFTPGGAHGDQQLYDAAVAVIGRMERLIRA
jgi:hypothetical protein